MAEIYINDLIKIIKEHPDYNRNWEKEVPAEQSLYIKFHNEKVENLNSIIFSLKNGSELVIDKDEKEIVFGIEII